MTINIIDSTASVANEVAEAGSIQIGGKTTIIHNSVGNSAFWFRGYTGNPHLENLENSDVTISTTRDIVYSGNYIKLTINKNSTFSVKTKYGFFRNNSHQASSILVDQNSSFLLFKLKLIVVMQLFLVEVLLLLIKTLVFI